LTHQPIAVAIADPADFGVAMRIGMIIGMEGATLNDPSEPHSAWKN
jgi:hypothetical protein